MQTVKDEVPVSAARGSVRLLQAGLGGWGRNWAREVLPHIAGVQTVGWVDRDPSALALACEQAGLPPEQCFESVEAAILSTGAEALLVTTALPTHVQVVRNALELGVHVLVEKPFAPSLAEARALVDLADERGLVLMVSQNYRFHPAVRAAVDLVRSGELGSVYEVDVDFRRLSEAGPQGRKRHHDEEQPLLVDMAIHQFDLMRLVLGADAARVYCRAWRPEWSDFNGPPVAAAVIEFEGGAVVSYRGSWISRGAPTRWLGEWRMECEYGEISWTGRGDEGVAGDQLVVRRRGRPEERCNLPELALLDRAGALHEFADAILSGRTPESSGRENLGSLALMEAAVASSITGNPVQV